MQCRVTILLALVNLVCGDSQTACSDGWMSYEGSCYLFGQDAYTFPDSESYCRQHNSHLVEIKDAQENAFIKDHLRQFKSHNWWMGMTDEVVEGTWKYYSTGSNIEFKDWHPGQPNDPKYGEDCAGLFVDFGFQWADYHCNRQLFPICMKSGSSQPSEIVG